MNFLAHLLLSGDEKAVIFGNFIGDGVKGAELTEYPSAVQTGISLHRFIDYYTDTHEQTEVGRKIIRPSFRKYAGVVLDMYFDHFLNRNWELYKSEPLPQFISRMHAILDEREPQMPAKTKRFYGYMKSYNWLLQYGDLDTLAEVFRGMAHRTPFESNMEYAVPVLEQHYNELEEVFFRFFPELINASAHFLETHNR